MSLLRGVSLAAATVCCLCIGERPHHQQTYGACGNVNASATPAALSLIVKFKHYAPWRSHATTLDRHAAGQGQPYRVVERENPAMRYPTDFLLVELLAADDGEACAGGGHQQQEDEAAPPSSATAPVAAAFLLALRRHDEVAGVYPQRSYTRRRTLFEGQQEPVPNRSSTGRRRQQQGSDKGEAAKLNARNIWVNGVKGAGVRVAVLDSGMPAPGSSRAFGKHAIRERTDWTNDGTPDDLIGHGTFVGGVIGGVSPECLGFAPEAEVHSFKVFNKASHAYTSWFIDAFNYAIFRGIHILNLSVGGPDWLDVPFVEKVNEMSSAGVIVVSAIGNDGPSWGTSVNPADMMDVIGVGGSRSQGMLAPFSSRGMTKHELPSGGYGRVKPDIVTHAERIWGPSLRGGCAKQSGTSVASPVVAGALALLASTVAPDQRWRVLNPASAKQILHAGAQSQVSVQNSNLFEVGAGTLDLMGAKAALDAHVAGAPLRASLFPPSVDMAQNPCTGSWPWCSQPLYARALPTTLNITIMSALGPRTYITAPPVWEVLSTTPDSGSAAVVSVVEVGLTEYSAVLWPWSGYLAIRLSVPQSAAAWGGTVEGHVKLTVSSSPVLPAAPSTDSSGASSAGDEETAATMYSEILLPLKLVIVPTPPRAQRLLWDQRHSLSYPPGFIPKDSFEQTEDFLDWHGDHPHTNYRGLYEHLRSNQYYLEILSPGGVGYEGIDAVDYSALLVVDPEDEFTVSEVAKLAVDVTTRGLSLLVFADWFDIPTIKGLRFLDDNTHRYWTPCTGGANVPALNELLAPYGIALGAGVLGGDWDFAATAAAPAAAAAATAAAQGLGGRRLGFGSSSRTATMCQGVPIARFPDAGRVWTARLKEYTSQRAVVAPIYGLTTPGAPLPPPPGTGTRRRMPPIPASTGLAASVQEGTNADGGGGGGGGGGVVALYGDSNCLDGSHLKGQPCYWLVDEMLSVLPTTVAGAGGAADRLSTEERLRKINGGQAWSVVSRSHGEASIAPDEAQETPLPSREASQLGAFRVASALWRESGAAALIAAAPEPVDEMVAGFS